MPFAETGAQELLERVHASGRLSLSERVADAARARHIVITLGTPSFSHIEIDMRDIRSALDDLLGVLAPGHCADPALDRRARHDRVRGRLPGQAPRLRRSARTCSWRTLPSASQRGASSRRSTRCPASSAASAPAPGEVAAELFGVFARADRADDAGAGRAREDLDEHPALHELRAAQPADDGLRAASGERVRGDRPDQPRLPARRHRPAGPHRRDLPAQGLRLLRGALRRRPGCCSPSRASTSRCRCSCWKAPSGAWARSPTARWPCSGWRSRPTPTTSATRSRTS